jgi:hypothetical protein
MVEVQPPKVASKMKELGHIREKHYIARIVRAFIVGGIAASFLAFVGFLFRVFLRKPCGLGQILCLVIAPGFS